MDAGAQFPPIVCFSIDGQLLLADGWHRLEAWKRLGAGEVEVDVREGGRDEALLFSREYNAKHGARFTFFSSSEIYGNPDPDHVPTQESYRGNVSCRGPRACYDESKRVGETLCYVFHDKYGTPTTTIRPFNIFGPGMQETDYRVLPNFASRLKAGQPLHLYGVGVQTRTFCYITDALTGFLQVIAKGVPGELIISEIPIRKSRCWIWSRPSKRSSARRSNIMS